MNKSSVVVVGLGRFGLSLARTLVMRGHEVLGLDFEMKKVEDAAEFVTRATQVDATEESALVELGIRNFDIGVVAIGSDVKSSIMVALLLKRLELKTVVAKASDELHGEILTKVGVDTVVYPERDTAARVAHLLGIPAAADYMGVMPGFGVARVDVPAGLAGKHLTDLDLKGRFGITVLILRRGKELIVNPSRYETIGEGDTLVVAARDDNLEALRDILR